MIKRWEIIENKWTNGSAYVLGIEGDDKDSSLILKELSSFCSLTDVKVSSFTHIFELPNVADDDILQKIRAKIEEVVAESSTGDSNNDPLQLSQGVIPLSSQEVSPEDIFSNSTSRGSDGLGLTSTDGSEIFLDKAKSSHIKDTENFEKETPSLKIREEEIEEEPKKEVKVEIKEEPKETQEPQKQGFFSKFFSFKKNKKEENKETVSTPLPIENTQTKTKNIITSSAHKAKQASFKDSLANNKSKAMHGVVVRGTAFPVEDLGAQKIKEVSLGEAKPILAKEQDTSNSLSAKVPLDDIFAAETICKFYDESTSYSEPKIEKIEEPTPMPTPKVITITKNKELEEEIKKASLQPHKEDLVKQENKAAPKPPIVKPSLPKHPLPKPPVANASLSEQPLPKPPVANASLPKQPLPKPPVANASLPKQPLPKSPVAKEEPKQKPVQKASVVKENLTSDVAAKSVKPVLTPKVAKHPIITPSQKGADVKKDLVGENKKIMNKENQENKKALNAGAATQEKVEKDVLQEPPAVLAEAEVKESALQEKESQTANKENAALKSVGEGNGTSSASKQMPKTDAKKAPAKHISMPHINETKIDGFDHTIQTSSIPVYKKSNWAIEMPIIPSFTLSNMDMSSNRFSHAAAMTVVENPGAVYNPFFVFGEGGCGKTHFLNAIGAEFSNRISQDKIFITNGVRFSRGVQRAIETNTIDKLKEMLDTAEVLIIDDVHLTAINEINRDFISEVLNDYITKHKQIVLSSKYPPQGLSRFEELSNFKLSQGWISELKPLRPTHFVKAYAKMVEEAQVDLTEVQSLGFFGRENITLGMIAKDIKRAKVLRRRIQDSGSPSISYEQLFNYITAVAGEDTSSQIDSLDLNSPLSIRRGSSTNWGNFGFFFPKDSADKFKWIVYATMCRAKELGIKGGFNFALKSAYSTEHIIASAFKIANICDSKNLKAAIILGPDPKLIQPAIRDNFYDILSHMLEVMMIRCAIISYEDLKKPSSYVKVLGDVLK